METKQSIGKISSNLQNLIKDSNKILITAHTNADADAICSILSMVEICRSINQDSSVLPIVWEKPNFAVDFLPHSNMLQIVEEQDSSTMQSFLDGTDLIIFLDIADVFRLKHSDLFLNSNAKKVLIDHHIDSCAEVEDKFDIFYNTDFKSTTVAIYNLFIAQGQHNLSATLAQNILGGLYGDTDFLTDIQISAHDFSLFSILLGAGADLDLLTIRWVRSQSINFLKAISFAQQKVVLENKYAYVALSFEQLQEIEKTFGYMPTKQDIVLNLKNLANVDFVFVILETKKNFLNCSIRTRTLNIAIEPIANHFGGGGHVVASAFRFETTDFNQDVSKILQYINTYVQTF